jgi:hypothetical protein
VTPKRETSRALGLGAVAAGMLVLTATACVLSYPGVHDLAKRVGIGATPAKAYPIAVDAMLVVAAVSVIALRGAGLPSRLYAWLCLIVSVAGLAAASVAQAAGFRVPHRAGQISAAIIPFVLVLGGFGLLIAVLRYARSRPSADGEGGWLPNQAAAMASVDAAVVVAPDLGADEAADPEVREAEADPAPAVDQAAPAVPAARPAEFQLRGRVQAELSPGPTPVPAESGDDADERPPLLPPLPREPTTLPRRQPPELRRPHSSPTPPQGPAETSGGS